MSAHSSSCFCFKDILLAYAGVLLVAICVLFFSKPKWRGSKFSGQGLDSGSKINFLFYVSYN